ncbi:TonB-dependent receptor [Mangrovibacterium marinum]|uniref:TonB-linked SusC/RagA family outer membrane protein n=1 Tax=Mangrovibacterium marinum TaxID=1639118 RepID=A0A2T5C5F0_9BACT|nr:TonB-dependent receptor [Mangrovibacterium marinum]PTN10125.1 TonB-linked SusC/RagA family outer membrane protein [Mangrovibacterium marinum]
MKLTFLLLCIVGLVSSYGAGYSQQSKISLQVESKVVKDVLKQIEDQSDYSFMYNASQLDVNREVTFSIENKSIEDVLAKLFEGQQVSYKIMDRHIIITTPGEKSAPVRSEQDKKTVTGQVKDVSGEPLPGVTVIVKGTTKGTIADFDGNFTLGDVSSTDVLLFSFVGMLTQEIEVAGNSTFNITMKEDAIGIEEVVAIGYGTQKKATLTGSIETVSSETFKDRAVSSPALSLQGQSPGLVVTRSSARPGNEGIDFQIRGVSSVNGGDPLIVIDGSPVINNETFYNMNPDDIEAISILKDASAAIYGSRAANGVILVTTKRGKGKMKVDVNSTVRINSVGIKPPSPSMSQYATVWLEAAEQDGAQANYWGWMNKQNLLDMQSGKEGIYTTQYWGDIFIGNAPRFEDLFGSSVSNQQNVSISGSSEKSSYRISGGYSEDVGMLKTAYDGKVQYNAMFNYDYDVTDWLKLESGVSYFNTHVSSPSTGLDATAITFDPPFFPAKNPYGQWYANFNIAGNRNSVAATSEGGRENKWRDQLKLNFAATVDIMKGLSFKATAAISKEFYDYQMYRINIPQYSWFGELTPESVNSTPDIRQERINTTYQNYGGFLNYNKTLGDHDFSVMAGITSEKREDSRLYGYRKGFIDYGVYDINLGSTEEKVEATGGHGIWGLYSYVGRLNYAYKSKYLFELNGRRDGSSKFAPGYRWANYGGGSVGWVVTEENFMKSISPVSFLKLRASYGEIGSQVGISNFSNYLSIMDLPTSVFGTPAAQQNAATVKSITTNTATWERLTTATYGVDFRLLDNKIFGSFDYYTKRNKDMLIEVNYPDLLGGTAPKTNSGDLKTHGWEAVLGYKNKSGDFEYNVSVNVGDSRNELVSMEGVSKYVAGKNSRVQGYALNSWFMYETNGFFKDQSDVDAYYASTGNGGQIPAQSDATKALRPGDTKRIDLDGSNNITDSGNIDQKNGDVKYMGDAAPHYNYGINLGLKYKNFDMSALFQGVMSQKIERSGYMSFPFFTVYTNQAPQYIGKTWTEQNPGAAYPRMTYNTDRARWNWWHNDFMLQNNRYVRLKSLVIGYNLENIRVYKYNIQKLRIYFSGNDLFEFTSLKDGYDPEYGESTNSAYPFYRTYSFGLNLTF